MRTTARFSWIGAALLLGTLATPATGDDELMPRRMVRPVTFGAIVVPEIYATDIAAPASECSSASNECCEACRYDQVVGFGPWPVRVCCQTESKCDSVCKAPAAPITARFFRQVMADGAARLTACTEGSSACSEAKSACCENQSGCTVACQSASCEEPACAEKCTRGDCCQAAKPRGVTITAVPVFEGARWFTAVKENMTACDEAQAACCENQSGCTVACQTAACDESACAQKCTRGECCGSAKLKGVRVSIPACEAPGESSTCFTFSCSTDENCQSNTACCENKQACEVARQTAACDASACTEACAAKCDSGECCRAKQPAVAIAVPACPAQRSVTSHAVLSDCGSPDGAMTDIRAVLAAQIEAIESNAACATACLPATPVAETVPAIGTLRHAAQALEQAACELENHELYARADQLRSIAAELRHDARGDRHPPISGINVQVIRPMAVPDTLPRELDRLHEQLQRVREAMGAHREPRLH